MLCSSKIAKHKLLNPVCHVYTVMVAAHFVTAVPSSLGDYTSQHAANLPDHSPQTSHFLHLLWITLVYLLKFLFSSDMLQGVVWVLIYRQSLLFSCYWIIWILTQVVFLIFAHSWTYLTAIGLIFAWPWLWFWITSGFVC